MSEHFHEPYSETQGRPENPGGGRRPENPGKGGGKGKLMQAHVFHGSVASHDQDSVQVNVEKYNRERKTPLAGTQVDVFVSSATKIDVNNEPGTIDSLLPGLGVVVVSRKREDGVFVARVIASDSPGEE